MSTVIIKNEHGAQRMGKPVGRYVTIEFNGDDKISVEENSDELRNVDLGNMTPIDALNKLYELQNKVKNRW